MIRFFEWTWGLALLVVLPIIGFAIFSLERRSRAKRLGKLGARPMLVRLAPFGTNVGMWRIVRMTGALALCGIAFAGPRWGIGPSESTGTGVDVVLALDASLSMMAQDAAPNRLENLKNVVRQLHAQSPNDRFALLAFAGHSYILSPLTTDQSAIDLYIDKLDPSTVGVAGSSIANAIHQATTLLSSRKDAGDRAIIVMSDGESFEPVAAVRSEAKRAGDAGIAMVTVGFGTPQGANIPVRDANGAMTLKMNKSGEVVTTRYMPDYLNAAAQAAHGVFVPADAADKAGQIRRVLDGLKTTPRATANGSDLLMQFEWFVIPALLLLALDTLLVLRPRRRQLTVARAAAAASVLVTAACQSKPATPTPSQTAAATAAANAKAEAARLIQYNRATKLFGALPQVKRDTVLATDASLQTAAAMLDSAAQSKTRDVRDRALYNSGWTRLVLSLRMIGIMPTPKPAVSGDTALAKPGAKPGTSTPATSQLAQAPSPGDSAASNGDMSDSAVKQRKQDTLMAWINAANMRYRSYLVSNPNDAEAKWNYELTLMPKRKGKGGSSKGKPKPKPPKQEPPPRMFRLPPQEAQQLLQAASQREQATNPGKATPTAPPPGGNDW